MNEKLTPFAIRLRRTRERLGLQQQEVAAMAGIHPVAMSAIECGRIRPGARIAAKIGHALDMYIDVRDLWPEVPPLAKGAKLRPQPKPKAAV